MNLYNKKIKYLICCVLLLLFSSSYAGQESVLEISKSITTFEINQYISYARDRDGRATYQQMLARMHEFQSYTNQTPLILRYTSDAVWVKLNLKNNDKTDTDWILEYRYPLIDDVELYVITSSGVKVMQGGDKYPGSKKIIKSRNFAFPVSTPPGESTLLIRVRSEGSLNVNLHIWGNDKFQEFIHEDQLFQGVFFGIMLALLFYNFSIFFFVRNRSYIFLVFFIISVSFLSSASNGFGSIYIWPDSVFISQNAHPVFIFLSIVSVIFFTCSFLNLKYHYPHIYKFSIATAAIIMIFIPLTFIAPYGIITQISVLSAIFIALFLTFVALISLKKTKRETLYYLSSYIFFAVGTILMGIRAYGATRETYYEVWGMQTGAALMVLLLSLGIADKIRSLRNEKERALLEKQESEAIFQTLFDNANDCIIIYQQDHIVYANNALQQLTGYNIKDLKDLSLEKILEKSAPDSHITPLPSYQTNGKLMTNHDSKIDVIISSAEAKVGGESAKMFIMTDVSSLKEAEETIRHQYSEIESQYEEMAALNDELNSNHMEIMEAHQKLGSEKEQLAATIKSITESVVTIDTSCRIILLNPEAERLLAYPQDEVIGKEFGDFFKFRFYNNKNSFPDPAKSLMLDQMSITGGNPLLFINRNGLEFILELTGNPVITGKDKMSSGVIILHDITQKYRLEQEILRVRKIDSLSVLAGGIAHDFNNLLTAILGNISIAKYSRLDNDEYLDFLDKIEQATAKATGLTKQLLTFSKGGDPVKRPESIRQLLQTDIEFILTGSKIKGSLDIAEDLLNAEVDISQFSQVIQNLILNAVQAMPDGGNLHITAENIESIQSLPLQSGRYIKISIIDDGEGIPEENLDKIFDPYFTTKRTGSGLGLSSCYSIIKRHGGYIEVKSSAGMGSSFNIYLPATDKKSVDDTRKYIKRDFGGKTVLLMDDDPAIRDVAGQMLKYLNLQVTSCSSGEEAVEIYTGALKENNPFDFIITDLIVPGGIGGETVIKKIKEIDPEVRSIAISGYANDPIMSNYGSYGFSACLSKPFDLNSLAAAVSQLLHLKK